MAYWLLRLEELGLRAQLWERVSQKRTGLALWHDRQHARSERAGARTRRLGAVRSGVDYGVTVDALSSEPVTSAKIRRPPRQIFTSGDSVRPSDVSITRPAVGLAWT